MKLLLQLQLPGLRSFTFMKHVGVNVASDSLMSVALHQCSGRDGYSHCRRPFYVFLLRMNRNNRHYARWQHSLLEAFKSPRSEGSNEICLRVIRRIQNYCNSAYNYASFSYEGVVELGRLMSAKAKAISIKIPTVLSRSQPQPE